MWAMMIYMLTEVAATHCPHHCECIWRDGKDAALCARAGFNELPKGLMASTQLLDFNENSIRILKDYVFSDNGLLNIQRLYLSSCDIEVVQAQTFSGLINLVELDLSKNSLKRIPSNSFFNIPGLRELKLSNNPIVSIKNEEFKYLHDLVRLSLKECKILEIEPRAFYGLERTLQYLDVSGNRLKSMEVSVVAPLRDLKDVKLFGNPWNCTCHMRPIRDWMIKRNVPITITPECAYPLRLRSRQWSRIDINEFACYPKLITATNAIKVFQNNDILLTCKVSVTPAPRIRWYRKGRLLTNTTVNPATGRNYIIYHKESTSELEIKSAELPDAGPYTCVSENFAGLSEAVITVTIEEHENIFGSHTSFAWLMIVAVITLCSCLIGLYFYENIKKLLFGAPNQEVVVSYQNDEARIHINNKRDLEAEGDPEMGRKRGDYRNVPSRDPEDLSTSDVQHLAPLAPDCFNSEYEHKYQNYKDNMRDQDLRIPRKSSFNQSVNAASSFLEEKLNASIKRSSNTHDRRTMSSTRPRKHNYSYSHISMTESENNYPDLIEMSSYEGPIIRNESGHLTTRRRKESDGYSPLINNSRRNSSGGNSIIYYEPYKKYRQSSWHRRSNSSTDLTIGNNLVYHNPSLPVTPTRHRRTPSATPLLDVNSLYKYSKPSYSTSDEFENHVFHMESLLNEFSTLGNQLNLSPKNTKDNLKKSKPVVSEEIANQRGKHTVSGTRLSSSTALPDAATPLMLNVADLNNYSVPERRSYLN